MPRESQSKPEMQDYRYMFWMRARTWNSRLYERSKPFGTQEYFANSLCEYANSIGYKRPSHFSQAKVSRWLRVGWTDKQRREHRPSKKDEDRGPLPYQPDDDLSGLYEFPPYEDTLVIAGMLGVDVGYLTGESDAKTFGAQESADFLELSEGAAEMLAALTKTLKTPSADYAEGVAYMNELVRERRAVIESALTSQNLLSFISTIVHVGKVLEDLEARKIELGERKLPDGDPQLLAIKAIRSELLNQGQASTEQGMSEDVRLMKRHLDAVEHVEENSGKARVAVYDASVAFRRLLGDIYPTLDDSVRYDF